MPDLHTDHRQYGELVEIIDDWGLYRRYKDNPEWINLVFVAPWEPRRTRKHPRKKTFWFGWNRAEQRISAQTDARVLRKRHEKIYFKLLQVCVREWPPER
jgi:hypothetical protein